MRRLRLDPLPHERLQPRGRAVEGIALWHRRSVPANGYCVGLMENAGTLTADAGSPASLRPAPALLERLRLPDSSERAVFDRLTALVAVLLDVPVVLLSVATPVEQVFASTFGVVNRWTADSPLPVTRSLCQHAVRTRSPLRIANTSTDTVAAVSEIVPDFDVVAYLGVPLVTSDGEAVGTLCAIDRRERTWSERDVRVLDDLAATVVAFVELAPSRPAATPSAAALNIAAVSRKTGIAPDTLRKWERRYGVLRPKRTAGGQRRYDDSDVARVEWLRDRLSEGFRISEAAALLDPAGEDAPETSEDLRAALVAAATAADSARLVALVEQAFALHAVDVAIEEIVQPALAEVGGAWRDRTGAIAEEHLLTEIVRARLERMLADRRHGVRGRVVMTCGPGERHDIGLLALGVMLQADGWLVSYLGADTPVDSVAELVERTAANALCLSFTTPETFEAYTQEVAATPLPATVRVVLGGAAVPDAPRLATAVAQLRR